MAWTYERPDGGRSFCVHRARCALGRWSARACADCWSTATLWSAGLAIPDAGAAVRDRRRGPARLPDAARLARRMASQGAAPRPAAAGEVAAPRGSGRPKAVRGRARARAAVPARRQHSCAPKPSLRSVIDRRDPSPGLILAGRSLRPAQSGSLRCASRTPSPRSAVRCTAFTKTTRISAGSASPTCGCAITARSSTRWCSTTPDGWRAARSTASGKPCAAHPRARRFVHLGLGRESGRSCSPTDCRPALRADGRGVQPRRHRLRHGAGVSAAPARAAPAARYDVVVLMFFINDLADNSDGKDGHRPYFELSTASWCRAISRRRRAPDRCSASSRNTAAPTSSSRSSSACSSGASRARPTTRSCYTRGGGGRFSRAARLRRHGAPA